jgi:hypothetical protein
MSVTPLNDTQLQDAAPSIFSQTPIEGVSQKYAFVPTHSVLDTFRNAGYYPIMAAESRVRSHDNQGYQKHIIQFRHLDNLLRPDANEEYADIVLTNSHNRRSSFMVDLAFFRIVCENMMVVPSHTFSHHAIIHAGFNLDKVHRAIDEVTAYMPTIQTQIDRFKSIALSKPEQHALAKAAVDMRFDTATHEVDPKEFLEVHRDEDNDASLWIVFNRIQEAMIRGGVKGYNRNTGRVFTSKPITAIDANIKLNKALFSTVQKMAEFKAPSLDMAA